METLRAICSNPWCKAPFEVTIEENNHSKICYKCFSLESETSGGVTWTEKTYEGSRFDNQPHQISINVNRAIDQNKKW
jgi:hypothetical protein